MTWIGYRSANAFMNSHSPVAAKLSTSESASSRMKGRTFSTERGVKARLTSLRRRAWSSPSIARIELETRSNSSPSAPDMRAIAARLLLSRGSASSACTCSRRITSIPIAVRAKPTLLAQVDDDRSGIGLELGREKVEERSLVDGTSVRTHQRDSLDVVVEVELPRVRAELHLVDLVFLLVRDPRVDDVGREHVALQQELVVGARARRVTR